MRTTLRAMRSVLVLALLLSACSAPELRSAPLPPAALPPQARPPPPPAAPSRDGWNTAQIHWLGFDEGVAAASAAHKPVCLVFSATWCPHCSNFSHVFEDAAVVAAARDFVMVRVDSDVERELGRRFAPDGAYVPRTYFLTPAGELEPDVKAHDGQFAYFYSERDPASLLDGMRRARLAVR